MVVVYNDVNQPPRQELSGLADIWSCLKCPWDILFKAQNISWYLALSKTTWHGPDTFTDVLNRTKCPRKAFTGNIMPQVIDPQWWQLYQVTLKTTGIYFTEHYVEEDPFHPQTLTLKIGEQNETENNFINIYIYIIAQNSRIVWKD